jgi:outer membrane protein assembly factor BamB
MMVTVAHRRPPPSPALEYDRRSIMPITRRTFVGGLLGQLLQSQPATAQTRTVAAPRPLAKDAITHHWTAFLGPTHNAVSSETRLRRQLPPDLIWEFTRGSGYASPAVSGERLVFLHRVDNEEIVECLHAETGAAQWRFRYRTDYEDRYGYNNGPRASPVIDGTRVYTVGAQGQLHCLDLATGRLLWARNLRTTYAVRQDFFGTGSTPLIEARLLILNVGAPGGPCVVALDKEGGQEVWRAGRDWGPSYASPVPATIHRQRRVLVFAGGESMPPTGGLLSIDPSNGRVDFAFPWRSKTYESVSAACPVVFENQVFISASYRAGGTLLEIRPDFTCRQVWSAPDFALHFNTPIYKDGCLYGFDGRNEPDASLACVDASTGKTLWRQAPEWVETSDIGGRSQRQTVGTYRGCLLAVDGQFLCLGELGHLLWMDLTPKGYREIARARLFTARETWTLPVLSRGLLYVVQNGRDFVTGVRPRLLCYDLRA